MAEGSSVAISLIEETEWGTTPEASQFDEVNWGAESLNLNRGKERKKKILATREKPGLVSKTQSVEGGIETVLQSGNIDKLLEGALGGEWDDVAGGEGGGFLIAGAAASNLEIIFTAESVAGEGGTIEFGSGQTISIKKDQVIFVRNTTDGINDGSYIVKDVTGQVVQVNAALTTATYEDTAVVAGDCLRNGSTLKSYSIERGHTDISAYFLYKGCVVSTLDFEVNPEEEVNANFEFMGKTAVTATSTASSPAANAAPETPDFVTGDNVVGVYMDYEAFTVCKVEDLSIKVDNGTEGRKSIAAFGPCGMRIKPIDVTGSITMLFESLVDYNQYINNDTFQLAYIIGDSDGNMFSITLAKVEWSEAKTNTDDAEEEVPEEFEFAVTTDGVFTIQICKYTA